MIQHHNHAHQHGDPDHGGHAHGHGHDHAHHHHHAPTHAVPDAVRWSLLRASLGQRLMIALAATAFAWAMIGAALA